MPCRAVQCSAVQCSAVQCSAVQCSAVQCSAVQCSAVQCSAVQDVWHTSLIHEGHYYQYQHDLSNSLKDVGTSYSIAVLTSKTKVPRAHQSTPLPCPLFSRISGARYSGVPQNVFVPPSAPDPKQWDQKEWISIVRSGDKSSGQESTGQESSGEERRGEERRGEEVVILLAQDRQLI